MRAGFSAWKIHTCNPKTEPYKNSRCMQGRQPPPRKGYTARKGGSQKFNQPDCQWHAQNLVGRHEEIMTKIIQCHASRETYPLCRKPIYLEGKEEIPHSIM
ncbi:hypothetical protein TWF225_002327 [Orbilia oligospora]|nr:hypothetical protein TWF225_002327 [Orbilia oligospora]KAF3257021.1 hypothetical protein TWF128_005158 [Orbilia oligospora]